MIDPTRIERVEERGPILIVWLGTNALGEKEVAYVPVNDDHPDYRVAKIWLDGAH